MSKIVQRRPQGPSDKQKQQYPLGVNRKNTPSPIVQRRPKGGSKKK